MIKYPLSFTVRADSEAGTQNSWMASPAAGQQSVRVAIPPEFDGPGDGLSPEDLYAMALQNCFVATFKVFAEKSRLAFSSISVVATLSVDRDERGRAWMNKIHFEVDLQGVGQIENAMRLLDRTSQNCMILNSVKSEKSFMFRINQMAS